MSKLVTNRSIPASWTFVSLKELGDWSGGGTPSKAKPQYWQGGTIPWVSPKDMKTERIVDSEDHITKEAVSHSTASLTNPGSVLIVTRSGILRHTLPVAVSSVAVTINQDLKALTPRNGIMAEYVAWALRAFGRDILNTCSKQGTTVNSVETAKLFRFEIPVAPTDQQHTIVAEIEKQFSRLDEAVANLKRVKANLKRYKASVLKAAVEGKLTTGTNMVMPTPFSELIEGLSQGWSPKCELSRDPLPNEWAIIKTTAVQSMRYLDSESKPLPSKFAPRSNIEIKAGDFLMTRKGPRQRAGVACLVRKTRSRLMVCDTVYRFRCKESRVIPAYLELALNSPLIVSEIDRRKSGISDSGVSLTHDKLGSVLVPMPQLAEQERIVAEVERRLSVIEELEAVACANLTRADRLRQSILSQAFNGKLLSNGAHG